MQCLIDNFILSSGPEGGPPTVRFLGGFLLLFMWMYLYFSKILIFFTFEYRQSIGSRINEKLVKNQ